MKKIKKYHAINNGKNYIKTRGFALLEVFIALLVITTIASTIFLSGITVNNYDKRKTTNTRIKYIQKILNQHIVTYGRLPCPVNPTFTPASETLVGGVCASPTSFNSGTTYYGAVPTDSLNISREYLQDGWGNKIMYIVPAALTYNNTINRSVLYYNKTGGSGYQISGVSLGAATYSSTDFANYISTYYNNATADVLVNNRNIYALLSYGDNGLGAYTISGTQNSSTGANATTGEVVNILTNSKTSNNFYTNQSSNGLGKLDDILYSTSINDIVSNNQSMLYCDASAKPDNLTTLPTPSGVPHYSAGSLVQFLQTCGVCPAVSGTRSYAECLSGGNWGSIISRACTC